MGKIYEWNSNPFQDYLFMGMFYGNDIASNELNEEIFIGISTILEYFVPEKINRVHLDYDIKKRGEYYKVIANNLITALWFSCIFPVNIKNVMVTNEYITGDVKYTFNEKTKKLTYKLIK